MSYRGDDGRRYGDQPLPDAADRAHVESSGLPTTDRAVMETPTDYDLIRLLSAMLRQCEGRLREARAERDQLDDVCTLHEGQIDSMAEQLRQARAENERLEGMVELYKGFTNQNARVARRYRLKLGNARRFSAAWKQAAKHYRNRAVNFWQAEAAYHAKLRREAEDNAQEMLEEAQRAAAERDHYLQRAIEQEREAGQLRAKAKSRGELVNKWYRRYRRADRKRMEARRRLHHERDKARRWAVQGYRLMRTVEALADSSPYSKIVGKRKLRDLVRRYRDGALSTTND